MPNWKKVITSGSAAVLSDLTLSGVAQPEIKFNGSSDAGVDFAIRATPEGLDFYEPEDSNKIHMQIIDDGGVDAKYGLKINGTSVLSSGRVLSNVTGNISMFTNNSGYVTTSGNTVIGTDSDITTSGATVIDDIYMTDGVITSHTTRTLTLANLGYTGATNANYITNNNQLDNGAGYTTNTGDITGVTAGTGLSGGASSGTATLNSVYLPAVDDRDMKPNTSGVGSSVKGIKPFFTSLGGMTGTANTDYQDALVLDTYSDSSGGNANCLIFDKSTFLIKHYNAASSATSWGTPKTIAYTSDIPSAANNATITISAGNALTTGGNFTTNQSSNETITIHHADTSTQASVNGSGRTYIQDITLDTYGHVTGIGTATETVTNTDTVDMGDGFIIEDGDGTEVRITENKEVKFVEGTGIDINWTDTSNGSDGDPYDLTITNTSPMTGDEFDADGTFASLRAQGTTKGDVGLGNVANESRATILGGNLTGTINSVAVATVTAGAALGATSNQDSTSTIRSGTTATNVGLGNVTNESKATMFSSAALTGNPTAPTQTAGNDSTRIATTAFVGTAIDNLIGGAPGTLDTLDEIAAALNDDNDLHGTLTTSIASKLPKSGGTMTGAIAMGNSNITGVNALTFADPGPNEGLSWSGGNMKLYESPNDLTTNTAGNLQIVYGTTRRLTIDNTGINVNGNATLSGFVLDGNTITGVDDSGEFTDNDAHIMTSAGVDDRITSRINGLTSNAGTMTSITINTATGLDGAGTLTGTGGTINLSLDLSEFTDMTADVVGSQDELILLDSGAERRKMINEIKLSQFNNDAGFTSTAPANNATITISAGNALTTGGNFTTNQGSNETITIHHEDTSTQASVNNSNGTVIQDVTLDTYGHVTALGSYNLDGRYYTETEVDTNFLGISAKAADSNLLDGVDLGGTRANVANKVVRTDENGYANFGWINTTSGNTTSTITDIYVNTNDGYIRKASKSEFQSQMGIQTLASNTDVDTGTETVITVSDSNISGYFFDYVVSNGANLRAGTVTAVEYDGTVEFNETSTADIGDTSDLTLFVDSDGTNIKLRATAASNNWSVKTIARLI